MNTPIETQVDILAELWMDYRDEEYFKSFFEYADIGFPLAYAISKGIVKTTPEADKFISDTWEMLLGLVALEDTGFDNLEEMLEDLDLTEE
jgi:hypothetical protein